ncbi:hypothetical protein ACFVW1_31970 [Streptomyces olivochromogenes]
MSATVGLYADARAATSRADDVQQALRAGVEGERGVPKAGVGQL